MTNLIIKDFQMSDLLAFPGENIWADMEYNLSVPTSRFLSLISKDGEVVAVAGWTFVRPGTVEVGIYTSDLVEENKLCFSKIISKIVNIYLPDMEPTVHRAEMYTDVHWLKGARWARFLGFKYEGICTAYSQDHVDHNLFSKIYQGNL